MIKSIIIFILSAISTAVFFKVLRDKVERDTDSRRADDMADYYAARKQEGED